MRVGVVIFEHILITDAASMLTTILDQFLSLALVKPSLKPQSSAAETVQEPMFLRNPTKQITIVISNETPCCRYAITTNSSICVDLNQTNGRRVCRNVL